VQPKHIIEQPIVQYDNRTHTIADEVQKKVESGPGNPLLANLKAKRHAAAVARGTHFGFNSNAERFADKRPDEYETHVGPGYYQPEINLDKKGPHGAIPGVNMSLPPRS
jgi:hypothetical protein